MVATIRAFTDADAPAVVALSLRAWAPVFDSMRAALGEAVFSRLYPSWQDDQARAVRRACADHRATTWVAAEGSAVRGFVVVVLHEGSPVGEIAMLAVDVEHQGAGHGRALTGFAVDRIRKAGRTVAMVETGGDPGHAPARRTYEGAGFTPMPIRRYFMAL